MYYSVFVIHALFYVWLALYISTAHSSRRRHMYPASRSCNSLVFSVNQHEYLSSVKVIIATTYDYVSSFLSHIKNLILSFSPLLLKNPSTRRPLNRSIHTYIHNKPTLPLPEVRSPHHNANPVPSQTKRRPRPALSLFIKSNQYYILDFTRTRTHCSYHLS